MRAYLAKQLLCVLVFLFTHGSLLINLTLLYHIDDAFGMSLKIKAERFLTITMTITFTPTSNTKEVEVEGYGKVRIRQYGAGEELQIAKNLRELQETQKKASDFLDNLKANYGEDESKLTDEEKAAFEVIQAEANHLSDELTDLTRSVISSEDPKVAERLFNELPITEIRKLISFALEKGKDAKTK